jgi:hypothetical protein
MLGRTRQSYYERRWQDKRQALDAAQVVGLVHRVRAQMPRLGVRKLYALLHEEFAVIFPRYNGHSVRLLGVVAKQGGTNHG